MIGYHLRGIDYMVEAKLAEGRAQEAEQKVQGRCMVVMQMLETLLWSCELLSRLNFK